MTTLQIQSNTWYSAKDTGNKREEKKKIARVLEYTRWDVPTNRKLLSGAFSELLEL